VSTLIDAVFSNDGKHLIVSINKAHSNISYLQIYAIQSESSSSSSMSSSPLIQGDKETLKPLYTEYHTFLNLEDFISFMVFDSYIFTVSHVNEYSFASFDDEHDDANNTSGGDGNGEGISSSSKSNGMVHYQMNVYKFKDTAAGSAAGVYLPRPELVQSVTLHLPEFKTPKSAATSSSNGIVTPQNPFLECSIELDLKKGEFFVVSSR
jgi:hypothetical protein